MLQMEEAKAEVEKKVSTLIKFIQNKNKIPKVTKKELVGIVNDLHEQCQLLNSVYDDLVSGGGRQGKSGGVSSSRSSSDLDYYSSEEIEINAGNVSETLSSDYVVMLRKLQETELTNEDLKRQVSNLKQETDFLRDQNMEQERNVIGKRKEDRETFKGMMTKGEVALLLNEKNELALQLEKKAKEVSETRMRLKRLEEEREDRDKTEQRKELSEDMKSKITEIDRLRDENKNLHTRIVDLDSLQKEREMANIDEMEYMSKNLDIEVSDQQKLVKEQEDIIHRLSMETRDQQRRLEEQKHAIEKFSEDQKLMKRWSFGSKLINTSLLERKMEELAEDFRMKMEDHMRILYRRIHVAEQIHLESKNDYIKTQDNKQTQENRGDFTVSETQFKKIKDLVEKGLAGPEMVVKKLEEGEELTSRVTRLAKEIEAARKWVHEKKSKMKHEVETLESKLECREAQETLLREKLSKLEAKLAEEGTGKVSLAKAMRRMKKLEIDVKERDVELMSLGEEKREAIRQLCVLVDYQRCRYDDLKSSIFKIEEEERKLVAAIEETEKQNAEVNRQLKELQSKGNHFNELEDRYGQEFNNFQFQLIAHQEERDAILAKIEVSQARLEFLNKTNVLIDAFPIRYDGDFGTINNFRLGSFPRVPVEWDEINAAWGQACLLLHTMCNYFRPKFQSRLKILWEVILELWTSTNTTYELFGPVNLFWSTRYDKAMTLYLICLKDFADFANSKDQENNIPLEKCLKTPIQNRK